MNGHCETCDVEAQCGYPYKPTECCNYRKFRPIEQRTPTKTEDDLLRRAAMRSAKVISIGKLRGREHD